MSVGVFRGPAGHSRETRNQTYLLGISLCPAAVCIALGWLSVWHLSLIRCGETSIEAHINASERRRHDALGSTYVNPYDFGPGQNVRRFLGLHRGRSVWRHVLWPSAHRPDGNGLTWSTVHDATDGDGDPVGL